MKGGDMVVEGVLVRQICGLYKGYFSESEAKFF